MKRSTLKALLVIFLTLSAASVLPLYTSHATPVEEERTIPILTYAKNGRFNCVAKLKPNLLYNQTTLAPEEGVFYMRIVEYVMVDFTYTFTLSQPANITIAEELNTTLTSPAGWAKTNLTTPGSVLSFDGIDDCVYVPASRNVFPPSDPTTVILRVKPTRLGSTWGGIIDQGRNYRDNFWLLEHATEDKYTFGLGNGTDFWEQTTPPLSLNTWYHLALTFSSANVTLYVDGSYIDSWNHGLTWQRASRPLTIGCLNDATGFGKADIDEVRIYNHSLSAAEIANDHDGKVTTDGLTLWLRLDGDAEDESGNGNNGEIHGAAWVIDGNINAELGKSLQHFTGKTANFTLGLTLNLTAYTGTIRTINEETGTTSQDYSLIVTPQIRTIAETGERHIEDTFEPALAFKAQYRTQKGDIYALEGLKHEDQSTLNSTETIYHPEVMTQRYASYALAIPSFAALAITTGVFISTRPTKPRKTEEEEVERFREIIVDIAEKPLQEGARTTVLMKTFNDLAKVAEELMKPILTEEVPPTYPNEKPQRVFYVIDGQMTYKYTGA